METNQTTNPEDEKEYGAWTTIAILLGMLIIFILIGYGIKFLMT